MVLLNIFYLFADFFNNRSFFLIKYCFVFLKKVISFGIDWNYERAEILNPGYPQGLRHTQVIVACLPLSHSFANYPAISLMDIKDEPFILFKEGAYNRRIILDECKKHGFEPNILVASDQIETLKGLVEKGVGVCFLIAAIANKGINYVSIPLADPLYLDFGLAWKKDKYLSRAAQAFINFITELKLSTPKEKWTQLLADTRAEGGRHTVGYEPFGPDTAHKIQLIAAALDFSHSFIKGSLTNIIIIKGLYVRVFSRSKGYLSIYYI